MASMAVILKGRSRRLMAGIWHERQSQPAAASRHRCCRCSAALPASLPARLSTLSATMHESNSLQAMKQTSQRRVSLTVLVPAAAETRIALLPFLGAAAARCLCDRPGAACRPPVKGRQQVLHAADMPKLCAAQMGV